MEKAFKFKYFSVADDRATMKVGTDAVLLGAWVNVCEAKSILDIGTGSGVIALMMAQRSGFDGHIDAIEPDSSSMIQASENITVSPWPGKIKVHNVTVQKFFPSYLYDLIICNPPYFNKSLLPPTAVRTAARHTETLSFEDLIKNVIRLLAPAGTFAVILPFSEGNQFRYMAEASGLSCHRSTEFYSRQGKPQERWLMEFSFEGKREKVEPGMLFLYSVGDQWTPEYSHLTREFYTR